MEFLIQPLEMGWDPLELGETNSNCPQNNAKQCGCVKNSASGCGCAQQSTTGPQTQ
jgi:hypothetical protein